MKDIKTDQEKFWAVNLATNISTAIKVKNYLCHYQNVFDVFSKTDKISSITEYGYNVE